MLHRERAQPLRKATAIRGPTRPSYAPNHRVEGAVDREDIASDRGGRKTQPASADATEPHDAIMLRYILSCTSHVELRDVYELHGSHFTHVHMSALLSCLAKTAPVADEANEYLTLVEHALRDTVTRCIYRCACLS